MVVTTELVEIRWHGRGGQGAVTSAELLAKAAIDEGKYAQAFPAFGAERRGAPVLAFNRINDRVPIRIRSVVTEPDIVIVLDPRLVKIVDATSGLKEGGALIVNSQKPLSAWESEYGNKWRLAIVDARRIAGELGIPTVNTTMLGALIKTSAVVKLESLDEPLRQRFGRGADSNIEALKKAFAETTVKG